MTFNETDIYTASGSVALFNQWTPTVHKFSTDSFYNWEQDNLPLYDLEERTYHLWEQNGFSTSAGVPGLALSVSADADADVLAANRNVFTDLSSCIAAIPKIVRFPVLVEVGSIGDLGPLELHNFRIEEQGSIEIINRGFSRSLAASSSVNQAEAPADGFLANASHSLVRSLSAMDVSSTLSDTKLVHLGTNVLSSTTDSRVTSLYSCLYPKSSDVKSPLSVSWDLQPSATANVFSVLPYERSVGAEDTSIPSMDFSALSQSTELPITRVPIAAAQEVNGCVYLNRLSKLSVKNCDGPIYIRNFFVDGERIRETAIDVLNSDVVLENCAAVRATFGFKVSNSRAVLSRSAFAYRNYGMYDAATRKNSGAGFHFFNSEITLSGNPIAGSAGVGDSLATREDTVFVASRNYDGVVLDNSRIVGGLERSSATNSATHSLFACELNNHAGVLLRNSSAEVKGLVDLYGNKKGIVSTNSNTTFQQICHHANEEVAIHANNSQFMLDTSSSFTNAGQSDRAQVEFSANGQDLVLNNHSEWSFQRKDDIPGSYGNARFWDNHGRVSWEGSVKASLPSISLEGGSKAEVLHPYFRHTSSDITPLNHPVYGRVVKVTGGSEASMFGSSRGCTFAYGPTGYIRQRQVAGFVAQDNSTIQFHGPTALCQFGVDILAENNSVINIKPADSKGGGIDASGFVLSDTLNHTSVELHSTRSCVVVDKNSTLNAEDLGSFFLNWARTSEGQAVLDQGVDYRTDTIDSSSLTTHGCLQFWPNPQEADVISTQSLDDLGSAPFSLAVGDFPVFEGFEGINRFFIKAEILNTSYGYGNNDDHLSYGGTCVRAVNNSTINVNNVHFPIGGNGSFYDGPFYTTDSDECARFGIWNIADSSRMQSSYLSVSGTHPISSQYHGPSALWSSSVDGVSNSEAPGFGAPKSTPDTGSLSVLDAFGAGSGVWSVANGTSINSQGRFYPENAVVTSISEDLVDAGVAVSSTTAYYHWGAPSGTSHNRGPFRIYWSPGASARLLQTDSSGFYTGGFSEVSAVVGPAYQLISQNYSLSSDCSALVPEGAINASGVAPELLKWSRDTDADGIADALWTSGYYYTNEFLEENPTQVMLDESAADVFANAKNASIGMSNRPKKVTVYRSRLDSESNRASEAYTGDSSDAARGFKSASVFDLKRDN